MPILRTSALELTAITWLPQVRKERKWSGEKILQGQGKVRRFYFESGKIDILKKSQGKLKELNMADLIPLKAGRNIWGHRDLNDIFP